MTENKRIDWDEIKISEGTKAFVECVAYMAELSNKVNDALSLIYDVGQVDDIMEKEYWGLHRKMDDVLYNFMRLSIEENMTMLKIKQL